MAPSQREPGPVDARSHRRNLCAAPIALAPVAGRNAARRRAGADAGRARWLARGVRGTGNRHGSPGPRRGRRGTAEAPDTRGELSDPRAGTTVAPSDRQPGVAAVRVAQDWPSDRSL